MALNTLKSRIKYRLSRSKVAVFTPQDFLDLSGRDQVGRALRQLIGDGQLIRFGYGLYAKAERSPYSGKILPKKALPSLAEEALNKLGVIVVPSSAKQRYNSGLTTQVPTGRVVGVKGRVSRKMSYNGQSVKLEHVAG
ncbi:MAG: hypothetical protein KBT53_06005 [Porticoccus sp.]|nr:hypothetical protein [Porticoccus sp.]MBQ0806841.1 hypothetical protein [Porticoccus sp.]